MLGPLKFGLQSPVSAVKVAPPGRFELTLSFTEIYTLFTDLTLKGPPGETATFTSTALNGQLFNVQLTIPSNGLLIQDCGSLSRTATFTGSNLITEMYMRLYSDNLSMTGITGTYPTALKILQIGFNHVDPVFTPPNVEALLFAGKPGPSSLTTGSNLIRMDFPSNLTTLNLAASTKITTLPDLPTGLTSLTTPPGITGFTDLPRTLTSLNLGASTKLTTLPTLPPRLTYLDLTGTNVTTLNIPPEMYPQLQYLKLTGSKIKFSGLLKYPVPPGAKWILY